MNSKSGLCSIVTVATFLVGVPVVAAPPSHLLPRGAELVGQVLTARAPDGAALSGLVYRERVTNRDGDVNESLHTEVFGKRRGRRTLVAKVRLPMQFAADTDHRLEVIDLHDGHWLVHFSAVASDRRDRDDHDRYDAYIASPGARGGYNLIWAGATNPMETPVRLSVEDIDGDADLEVVQVQSHTQALYCGRTSSTLFPRIWDFERALFRPAIALGQAAAELSVVRAVLDDEAPVTSHFPNLVTFRTASSDLRDVRSGRESRVSLPTDLGDGMPETAWIEGVAGWGLGEFVTANVNSAFQLRGLRIIPGLAASEESFAQYGAPKTLLLAFDDDRLMRVDLPSITRQTLLESGGLYVEFGEPIRSQCMSVIIADVYPAAKPPRRKRSDDGKRTAISELTPLLALDYEPRQEALRQLVGAIVSEGSVRRQRALTALAKGVGPELGPPVTEALTHELAKDGPERRPARLIPLLALVPKADGEDIIKQLLAFEGLTKGELATLLTTVSFQGRAYEDLFFHLALDPQVSALVRERATRIVGRAGSVERMGELIPAVGQGTKAARKSVIRGLSRAGIEVTDRLLDLVADEPGSTRSHDGLWILDRISRRLFRGKPGHFDGAERIYKAYSDTEDLQIRLRALRVLTRLVTTNGDLFLATVLESHERPEIRTLAAEALAAYKTDKATDALISALTDASPTIRIQAARSLRSRPNLPRVATAVGKYARTEDWSTGLEQAYLLLAASSDRDGADYLYELIAAPDNTRAALALTALNHAQHNIRAIPLEATIRDPSRPLSIQRQAVKALAWTIDQPSEKLLLAMVDDETLALKLRVTVIRTLGRRRSPAALFRLSEVAADNTAGKLQKTAIRVLAHYPSRDALDTLKALQTTVDPALKHHVERSIEILELRLKVSKFDKYLKK